MNKVSDEWSKHKAKHTERLFAVTETPRISHVDLALSHVKLCNTYCVNNNKEKWKKSQWQWNQPWQLNKEMLQNMEMSFVQESWTKLL